MKTVKKILMIICIIIIVAGMFILGRQGLNYVDGYTQEILLETAKDYTLYAGIATTIVLIYLIIRYNKQGVAKVAVTSVLGIIGAVLLTLSIMAIIRMPITRLFFPIILVAYVSSIVILSSNFEDKV